MKILFVHQNFPGQFKFLAPALSERGHEVLGMTLRRFQEPVWRGVKIFTYAVKRGSSPNLHSWISDFETKTIRGEACFFAALNLKQTGFHPDLIVAHHGWGESLFLKEVWPKARFVIYCEFYYKAQGADVGFDPEFPLKDPNDRCRVRLKNINNLLHLELADAALCPTLWQASTFPEFFREKIRVIHDGIDTALISPGQKICLNLNSNLSLNKGDEIVTFASRNLEPLRGYHIFMRALPRILRCRPNARILIIGGDDVGYGQTPEINKSWKEIYSTEIRQQVSYSDQKRVHFLGKVPHEDFISILQVSAVHVYLTYPFVLSWSVLEAMSVGCAVVGSRTAPVEEVIADGENGLLIDFFDHQQVADTVCRVLSEPLLRAKLGEAARSSIVKKFDLKNICLPAQLQWIEQLV